MSLGSKLAPELPFLRRYARAVTGSQPLGDAAVRHVLERILESPEQFDEMSPVRQELYRTFHRHWRPAANSNDGGRPMAALEPEERFALLLTSVEGFAPGEAAEILGSDAATVANDVERARRRVTEGLTARILIIEDEPLIALHIKEVVEDVGNSVCSIARTREEAVRLALETEPQLVLADINLADGSSGIHAVQDILLRSNVPAVFVTAFPERLLTGRRPEPTYLITKPFEESTLVATIGQALMFHRERADQPEALQA